MTNMSIQPLWLTYFIETLLVLEFQLTKTYFSTFSYMAHFRPQISSNDKKSQDKRFEKIQSKNNLLENKVAQIQKEASRLSEKQSQVEEVNSVIITDKK